MPNGFGQFGTQGGFGGGFGGGGRKPSVVEPYMPTPAEVQEKVQEQNEPGMFWKILQVPERVLGGQMIRGFLAGTGEDGLTDNILTGLRNNPLFQIIEAIPGVDGLVDDKSFSDVRKAWGDHDTDEGVANFAINVVGDILTSPFELMFTPFGKIAGVGAKATAFSKGSANFGKVYFDNLTKGGAAGLAAAFLDPKSPVKRALFAFKVPFSNAGFAFKAPKNLDVNTAKVLDGMVGWLNTNPATKAVLDIFTKGKLRVQGAGPRAAAEGIRDTADQAARETQAQFLSLFNDTLRKASKDGMSLDIRDGQAIQLLSDLSITEVGELSGIFRAIEDGVPVSRARGRTRTLLGQHGPTALMGDDAVSMARQLERDMASQDLNTVQRAIDKWDEAFPEHALPDSLQRSPVFEQVKHRQKVGRDLYPHEYVPQDVRVADIEGAPILAPNGQRVAPGILQGPAAERGAQAATEALPSVVQREKYLKTAKQMIQDIADQKGLTHLQKLNELGGMLESLSHRLGIKENTEGFLNKMLETYIHRDLTPEMRKLLGVQLSKVSNGRVNMESTVLELNMWAYNEGTRLTNGRAVSLFGGNGSVSLMELMSKVIPDDMAKKLFKAGQLGNEAAAETGAFLLTNPFYATYARIRKHVETMRHGSWLKGVYDDGILVQGITGVGDVVKNTTYANKGMVGRIYDSSKVFDQRQLANGEHVDEFLRLNNSAKKMEANYYLNDYFEHVMRQVEGNVGPQQGPLAAFDATLRGFDDLTKLKVDDVDEALAKAGVSQRLVPNHLDNDPLVGNLRAQAGLTNRTTLGTKGKIVRGESFVDETGRPVIRLNEKTGDLVPEDTADAFPSTRVTTEYSQKTIYDGPRYGRGLKPVDIDDAFISNTIRRYRDSYFAENKVLQQRLDQSLAMVDYWGTTFEKIGDTPLAPGLEKGIKEAEGLKSLAKENIAAAVAERSRANKVLAPLREKIARRITRWSLVEDPRKFHRLEEKIKALDALADPANEWLKHAKTAEGAARVDYQAMKAQLAEAKAVLEEARKPIYELRKQLESSYDAAVEDVDLISKFMDDNRQSIEILNTPDAIEQAATGENKFLAKLVANAADFEMAGRRGQWNALKAQEKVLREARIEKMKDWNLIRKSVTDAVKAEGGARKTLVKEALDRELHGSEVYDELYIALQQQKTGQLPTQHLDTIFEQRAQRLRETAAPNTKPVTAQELKEKWAARHPEVKIHWFDADVHEGLFGKGGLEEKLFSPSSLAGSLGWFDAATSWWKAAQVLPPTFIQARVRDVMTNMLTTSQGTGVLPTWSSQGDALRVASTIGAALDGRPEAALRTFVQDGAGKTWNAREVLEAGQRTGIVNPMALVRDEVGLMTAGVPGLKGATGSGQPSLMSKIFSPNESPFMKTGAKLMEFGDNQSKLAAAIAFSRKNKVDLETAMNHVKQFAYDPSRMDLSNAERYLFKRIMPFYSYTKFVVQGQVKALFRKPGTLTWTEKAHANSARAQNMTDGEMEAFLPEFINTNLGVPVKKRPDGLHIQMFGGFIPFAEVNRLFNTLIDTFDSTKKSGITDYIGAQMNPFLRIPIETWRNRSFYTQRPITQFEGQRGEFMGVSMPMWMRNGLVAIRGLNEVDNLNVLNFGDLSKMMATEGAVQRRQYSKTSLWERAAGSAFSPLPFGKPYFLSSEQQARMKQGQYGTELSALKHDLKTQVERGNPTVSKENISRLQELIAEKQAQMAAADSAARKLGVVPQR